MTYSLDFRKKVLAVKEKEGLSFAEVSQRFAVGLASVVRWPNNIAPKKRRESPAIRINMKALQEDALAYPDAYQYERAKRLGASKNCVWRDLKKLKVTYKKTSYIPRRTPKNALLFAKLPNIIKMKDAQLSLLMSLALLMICHVLTGMHPRENDAMVSMTGELKAALMS